MGNEKKDKQRKELIAKLQSLEATLGPEKEIFVLGSKSTKTLSSDEEYHIRKPGDLVVIEAEGCSKQSELYLRTGSRWYVIYLK